MTGGLTMTVRETTIPEQRNFSGTIFPRVFMPDSKDIGMDELKAWIAQNKAAVKQTLLESGAILLRGFGVKTPEDFADLIDAGGFEPMPYLGGAAPRNAVVGERVLTSNESPPSEPIPFHHEMAQVPQPPAYVFFYCELPSNAGGETPIVLSHQVYRRLVTKAPEFAQKLEELGVKYVRVMPEEDDPTSAIGRSWKSTFLTHDRREAEEKMKALGTTWEWLADGSVRTVSAVVPAIRTDKRNQQKTFFNSVVAAYTGWVDSRNDPKKAVRCGDDSPLDEAAVLEVAKSMQKDCVAFRWQKGDVLLIDNGLVMHSRRPFTGPRRILASIAKS